MMLGNIVRAAVSEIEEYERVSVHAQPEIALSGPAVNDIVHLLAELIQNATSFSAVDMPVEVSGQVLNTGGVLISITDRGVGMSVQDISHANWRLENPPPVDIDVPKWIGLLVVSRLAARRGARVRLQHAELGGLTALVWIPDELIARPDMRVRPEFTRPGPNGPRRGAHEPTLDLRGVGAQRIVTPPRVAEPVASREEVRSALPSRRLIPEEGLPGPAGPPASPEPVPQAAPATAGLQQEKAADLRGGRVELVQRCSPGARFGPHRRQGRGPVVLAGRRGLARGADGRSAGRRIPDGGRAPEAATEREPGSGRRSRLATRRRAAEPFGRRHPRPAGWTPAGSHRRPGRRQRSGQGRRR